MYIKYFADNSSMGDTSPADCNLYRRWAANELHTAFPDYAIEVRSEPSIARVITDDETRLDEIDDFCARLWDRCPWNWQ